MDTSDIRRCGRSNWTDSCNASNSTNDTVITESPQFPGLSTLEIVIGVYYAIAWFAAILGNGLLIATVLKRSKLHRAAYILAANLALKDLTFALAGLILSFPGFMTGAWYFNHESCVFYGFLTTWLAYVELLLLVAISVDRYIACDYPLRYSQILTSARLGGMLAFCWLYGGLWSAMPLLGFGDYVYVPTLLFCQVDWNRYPIINSIYVFAIGGCVFFPGTTIIVFCYVKIYRSARRVSQPPTGTSLGSTKVPEPSGRPSKATKTISFITGIYFLCWIPYVSIRLCRNFFPDFEDYKFLTDFEMITVLTFTVANYANPVIYGVYNREFRRELTRLCVR